MSITKSEFLMLKMSVWSISILTSITGLAISPSLPTIQHKFPNVRETEIDMLISLPNLLLIPFVILAGRLAQSRNNVKMIAAGALFFILSAIAYQFANTFTLLLIISIALGMGASMVVPLASQLPSVIFQGKEKQKQLGICSGISNASQVLCTLFAGWLATISWHAPFWVYSIAIIPLIMSPFLRLRSKLPPLPPPTAEQKSISSALIPPSGINKPKLIQLMVLYFVVMFFNLQIPLSLPFLLSHHHLDAEVSGILISIFFSVQAASAFIINQTIHLFRKKTMVVALFIITVALFLFPFVKGIEWYYVLVALAGVTGGTIEPLIWNKTSNITSPAKSALAFGWIMSACYLSIWATPYILNLLSLVFRDDLSTFPFYISGGMAVLFTIILLFSENSVIFGMKEEVKQIG
ncbi:MAG: MFS transporter [Bacteroidales bacterium]